MPIGFNILSHSSMVSPTTINAFPVRTQYAGKGRFGLDLAAFTISLGNLLRAVLLRFGAFGISSKGAGEG